MQTISMPFDDHAIATKAYELWCARGYPEGSAENDWYEALAQLRSATALPAAKTAPSTPPARSPMAEKATTSVAPPKPVMPAVATKAKARVAKAR